MTTEQPHKMSEYYMDNPKEVRDMREMTNEDRRLKKPQENSVPNSKTKRGGK